MLDCEIDKFTNRKNNVYKLKELSTDVYVDILETFPWAVISNSVHRILAHSWECVQINNNYGLGDLSGKGLESCIKWIRRFRITGARKNNTFNNF